MHDTKFIWTDGDIYGHDRQMQIYMALTPKFWWWEHKQDKTLTVTISCLTMFSFLKSYTI